MSGTSHLERTGEGLPAPAAAARRLPLLLGLGLAAVGGLVALLSLGLVFNLFSLRWWLGARLPWLAVAVAGARDPLDKASAQGLEGVAAGLGLCLLAAGLTVALVAVGRARPGTARGAAVRRLASATLLLTIAGCLLLAVALPFLAVEVPPGLRTGAVLLRRLVSWLLRLLPGF